MSEMQKSNAEERKTSLNNQLYNQSITQCLIEQQETTEKLAEQQANQQKEIDELKQKLTNHKLQTKKQISYARSELKSITRKILLSPQARRLYEKTKHLKRQQRQQRYLKRLVRKFKILNAQNHQKYPYLMAKIMQQKFINMLQRNSDVASQVYNTIFTQ